MSTDRQTDILITVVRFLPEEDPVLVCEGRPRTATFVIDTTTETINCRVKMKFWIVDFAQMPNL